jgi:hypothetical protein
MIDQTRRSKPKLSIDRAIQILQSINGKVVVEIGSMRQGVLHDINDCSFPCCNDGHSSMLWARTGLEFHTVDIDATNYMTTKLAISEYMKSFAYCCDGITFLKTFKNTIDLLFLDAWDVGMPLCAEKHVEAYEAAQDKLAVKHLILIDDTDVDSINGDLVWATGHGGKGKLLVPKLLSEGYKLEFDGRQTLLSKGI